MENPVHLVIEVVSISQLLTQEWSKKLLSAFILPTNQTCSIIWSMYNTRQTSTREKCTTFFSCFYLTSIPKTCLVTMRDTAGMKQEAKKCQRKCENPGSIQEAGRKKLEGQQQKIRAETGSSTRIFLSKWLVNRTNILKSFCAQCLPH